MPCRCTYSQRVVVENHGSTTIYPHSGVNLAYQWADEVVEPRRTAFIRPLRPGERALYTLQVDSPAVPGRYQFTPRLVHEGVRWFESSDVIHAIEVTARAPVPDDDINRYEDRIASQNGEDGILRELLLRIGSPTRFIVEIGAGDGGENNSTQLIERYGFSACLIEGDPQRTKALAERFTSRDDVIVIGEYVTADSICAILSQNNVPREPDVLSIDIDGNDYHIWRALAHIFNPQIIVIEYNARKGPFGRWVMPYDPGHRWNGDDHFGASLTSLADLGSDIGYELVGTDSAGVNAFFVRRDAMKRARFEAKTAAEAYHASASLTIPVAVASRDLRDSYTHDYYINDCGGHTEFGFDDALSITDPRLRITANFAEIRPGRRALDLGCGRGEIAAYLAARGWEVDAIDYSADAIALARDHARRTNVPQDKLRFHACDFDSFDFDANCYDLVIAADVIEHLAPDELSRLYQQVSKSLTREGLFVLHTFPNQWFYKYQWPRLRRAAVERGEAFPVDPRSAFEQMMHINEQSPRSLAHQLRSAFEEFVIWVGDPLDPFRSPVGSSSHTALRTSSDIFALASHSGLEGAVSSDVFSNTPVSVADRRMCRITLDAEPVRVSAEDGNVSVTLHNESSVTLSSAGRFPVMLSYHWLDASLQTIVFDGKRTPLGKPVRKGEAISRRMVIGRPPEGAVVMRVSLVQEGVAWFDEDGSDVRLDVAIAVTAR